MFGPLRIGKKNGSQLATRRRPGQLFKITNVAQPLDRGIGVPPCRAVMAAGEYEQIKMQHALCWHGLGCLFSAHCSVALILHRSEERRVGKECVSPCISRGSPSN